MSERVDVELAGERVSLSNLGKVLWPELGLTKAWMVDYYVAIAPVLVPHLRNHPLTLHRFPNGVHGIHWYETRAPSHPPWIRTTTIHVPTTGKVYDMCVLDDLPSLVWAAQIAAVELHPFLATVENLHVPRAVVFDLDPGHPATLVDCCRVALRIKDLLADVGLEGWAKTSGGAGLHLYFPLNTPVSYERTKAFARAIAPHPRAGATSEGHVGPGEGEARRKGVCRLEREPLSQVDDRSVLAARLPRPHRVHARLVGRGPRSCRVFARGTGHVSRLGRSSPCRPRRSVRARPTHPTDAPGASCTNKDQTMSPPRDRSFPLSARQVIGLLLLVLAAIFVLENRRSTTVRFLIPEVTAPLWVALLVSMLVGVIAGALMARRRDS